MPWKRNPASEPLSEPILREKVAAWCLQRWRSVAETRRKLREWGAAPSTIEGVIDWLLAERFLDEERFARGFVADKTNLSGWGRRKVLAALAIQHGVKGQAAQAAIIAGLDEARYTERLHTTLQAEFRRYGTQQPEELPREHLHAIVRRLAARGYTSTEIWHAVGRSGPDFDHETTLHLGTDTHNP